MSETQISKRIDATIKVSSLDSHKIVSAVPRKPAGQRNRPGAPAAGRPPGGQPIAAGPDNVQISKRPNITHVTSSSSSQKSEIKTAPPMPPVLAKKLEDQRKLLASQQQVSDHLPEYKPEATKPDGKATGKTSKR